MFKLWGVGPKVSQLYAAVRGVSPFSSDTSCGSPSLSSGTGRTACPLQLLPHQNDPQRTALSTPEHDVHPQPEARQARTGRGATRLLRESELLLMFNYFLAEGSH